ncbi:hypothetical protein ACX0MV_07775 [Pseudomonas borbori]
MDMTERKAAIYNHYWYASERYLYAVAGLVLFIAAVNVHQQYDQPIESPHLAANYNHAAPDNSLFFSAYEVSDINSCADWQLVLAQPGDHECNEVCQANHSIIETVARVDRLVLACTDDVSQLHSDLSGKTIANIAQPAGNAALKRRLSF